MKLTTVHQIVIGSFVGLGLIYAARSLMLLARTGQSQQALFALAGVTVALAAGLYLRKFRKQLLER